MKGLVWLVAVIVVAMVVGGLFVYRSTAPNGDVVPEGESVLEEADDLAAPGQFIQVTPSGLPAAQDNDTAEPTATGNPTSSPEADSTRNGTSGEGVTVSMTDAGFVPANVTIAAGDTVVFVNNGQALHWPASDVHPTHEILSEFDANRGIATGGSYSYTFEETGSWGYHDHLNPQFTGTITVE